jgi:DNA-binding response OmpR family regulator
MILSTQKKLNSIMVGCDNETRAARLESLFTGFSPRVEVSITDSLEDLVKLLKKKLPDIIVLHFGKSGNGYMEWLKKIRKIKGIQEVPVIIYTGKTGEPDKGLLEMLVDKLKK